MSDAAGTVARSQAARVAIDLGAESCRVSLLRWSEGVPAVELIHRIANGPVHADGALRWPFDRILAGLDEGLRKAAEQAAEGIASIAVDGWAVDYLRLGKDGVPLANPFCYRDERTLATQEKADTLLDRAWMFAHTGAQPLRINTVYQLMADSDRDAPWINLPEYVLHWLGGRRVAEYTNATHTGLIDLATGTWSESVLDALGLSPQALPPIVPSGRVIGKVRGPLAALPALQDTDLIVPACHDTASAIAGIPTALDGTAYICSGTWSLVGTRIEQPLATPEAMAAGFTNQGAAGGGYCFHTNVNGMWILKQCLEGWRRNGRPWELPELIAQAERCDSIPGIVPVDAPPLLLDGDMPALLNEELRLAGCSSIDDRAGREPVFARMIFESLAARYASALRSLESLLGRRIERIHVLGGGSQNRLLTRLTSERTGLPVEAGNVESSTVGNFAVQLASAESGGDAVRQEAICKWAQRLCEHRSCGDATHPSPSAPPPASADPRSPRSQSPPPSDTAAVREHGTATPR